MPLSVDYSDDWQWVDGVETISLTPSNPSASAIVGLKAVRASVNEAAVSLGGDYGPEPRIVQFYVWTDGLDDHVPRQGWKLTDEANVSWSVVSASLRSDATQWSLACVKQI